MAINVQTDTNPKETEYQRLAAETTAYYRLRMDKYVKRFEARKDFLANNGTLGDGGPYLQHVQEEIIMDLLERVIKLEAALGVEG